MTSYTAISQKLLKLNFAKKSRLDLSSVLKLYHVLNIPYYPKVHVAGTNGKGSCVTKIAHVLTSSGYTCGMFTSPHIATIRERIQINGKMISKKDLSDQAMDVFDLAKSYHIELTFFEIMTLIALKYFADQKVDLAVIEVGLGGRLDATNCITPILSIITSISLDHTHILGNTLEEIAQEKAGIIKENIPVVIGPSANQNSIKKIAQEKHAELIKVSMQNFQSYDEENQAIACAALQFLIKKGFKVNKDTFDDALLVKPPCRYEVIDYNYKRLILDVSHNEDAMLRLIKQINHEYPNQKKVVFTSMAFNHDYEKNLKLLLKFSDQLYILDINHPRLTPSTELLKKTENKGLICSMKQIKPIIENMDAVFVFTGSVFIMKEIYALFDSSFEKDAYEITDGFFKSEFSFYGLAK